MNLTQTAAFVKKFLKYTIILVSVYYLLTLIIFPGSVSIFKTIFKEKEVPANTIYGQLEPLEFLQKSIKNTNPEFVLNTTNAKLPTDFPDRMKVYKFKPQQYSYLAGKNAVTEAEKLGFTDKDLLSDLKGDTYKWRNSSLGSNLTININTREINLTTNLSGKSGYFIPGSIDQTKALQISKKILTSIFRFNEELYPAGTQKVILGAYTGNKLYETNDTRKSQIAMVDFYRSIENFPIFGPDPSKGLIRISVKDNEESGTSPLNNPILEAYYWEIITQTEATYPIIGVDEAWNMVKTGNGVITNVTPNDSNPFETSQPVVVEKILIDNIFLAYYETPKYQSYLQPIYVFSGKYTTRGTGGGDIAIYFPAVMGQYTKQTSQQQQ